MHNAGFIYNSFSMQGAERLDRHSSQKAGM